MVINPTYEHRLEKNTVHHFQKGTNQPPHALLNLNN